MADLLKQINLKKPVVNRKLIAWAFVITGALSVGMWWRGRGGGEKKKEETLVAGWSLGELWGPLKISYGVEGNGVRGDRTAGETVAKIKDKLAGTKGEYSFLVSRLGDKTGYGWNEDKVMPAASIMKVPIMAAVFTAVEEGRMKLEDTYVLKEGDKQSGSGPIEFMKAGTGLTVRQMLEEMGKKSDNSAPIILVRMVGKAKAVAALAALGMKDSDFEKNTTTAYDVATMWKRLYEGEVVKKQENREMMWEFLQGSIYEDRIAAGVPAGTKVVHKVGSGEGVWADAGIVYADKPFVVVILNEGVKMEEAQKLVPEMTRIIWEDEAGNGKKE